VAVVGGAEDAEVACLGGTSTAPGMDVVELQVVGRSAASAGRAGPGAAVTVALEDLAPDGRGDVAGGAVGGAVGEVGGAVGGVGCAAGG